MATSTTEDEIDEQKKKTGDLGTTPPLSPQLKIREESVIADCSLEYAADMDTSSPLKDLKTMIDQTFGGPDPTDDGSRSGSVKSPEMGESTYSSNLAPVTSNLEKLTMEEKRNFILEVLKDVPLALQVEMLSKLAKKKDVGRQTLPLFSSRAVHFQSADMEIELGSPRTWCPARRPTPYPSRPQCNQFSDVNVQNVEALSSPRPLETLFGISEDSVYEDAKDTVFEILELPMALDQPESEQRARALVHAVHQQINDAMSKYIDQQKVGEPASLSEAKDQEAIDSGYLVQISGQVTAAIMADLAACSCSKPYNNLYSRMAAIMQKLSERLKSKAGCKGDPEDVLPTPSMRPPSVVLDKSASLNGSLDYFLGENIATFSKEDLTEITRAASAVLTDASRCISTELLPTPEDVDAEVLEIVQTVASDMQRLYDSTEESSTLKELVIAAPSDSTEKFSMDSRLALNSTLAGIYKNVHEKIKSLFSKSAILETEERDTTPAQKASSETRPVSSFSISPEPFQTRSSSSAASCSSPHVPADLEVDELKDNVAEVNKYTDSETELSGLMEQKLFIGEDPASVETKMDILLNSDAFRPLTDKLAEQIHACSSPHVPVDLEIDESKENLAEVKEYKDSEVEFSGLMEQRLFVGEDPASVEIKPDIPLDSDALRPLTDELAEQIHACSSPHVSADLEVDKSKENVTEGKKYKDAEAKLSGLMEQMLVIGEDPASVETKLDILLNSDVLRPLTDELAEQIHAFMQANGHVRAPATRQAASDTAVLSARTTGQNRRPVSSQEGFKDLVYVFTESKIRALLETLVALMGPTADAVETIQCSHSTGRLPMDKGGCCNRLSCIFQEITGLFTRKTAKKVSDTMFQTSCCLPLIRTEEVMTQAPSHSDRNLRSVVSWLVARNLANIGAKIDSREVSGRVSTQVLSLVSIASGLNEDQVYPEDIDLDDVYKTVKTALRAQFKSKEGLRTAMANIDPLFERSLVCFLSYALVIPVKEREGNDKPQKKPSLLKRLFKKKAKQKKSCQTFSNKSTTSRAEETTMPSVATPPEESPATEQRPQKMSVWLRFCSAIVKAFT